MCLCIRLYAYCSAARKMQAACTSSTSTTTTTCATYFKNRTVNHCCDACTGCNRQHRLRGFPLNMRTHMHMSTRSACTFRCVLLSTTTTLHVPCVRLCDAMAEINKLEIANTRNRRRRCRTAAATAAHRFDLSMSIKNDKIVYLTGLLLVAAGWFAHAATVQMLSKSLVSRLGNFCGEV